MPLTQHFWVWDRFLHGGRDFETGLQLIVTLLCFLLLRTHHNREDAGSLLAIGIHLLSLVRSRERRSPKHPCRPAASDHQKFRGRPEQIPLLI